MMNHIEHHHSTTSEVARLKRRAIAALLVLGAVASACSTADDDPQAGDETMQAASTTTLPAADGDLEAWCFSWLDNSGISDENGTEAAMRAMLARVEAEAEVAPSEIGEPMQAHLEATRIFVQAMEAAGWDEENLTPEDMSALDPDLTDGVIEALDSYAAENCSRT